MSKAMIVAGEGDAGKTTFGKYVADLQLPHLMIHETSDAFRELAGYHENIPKDLVAKAGFDFVRKWRTEGGMDPISKWLMPRLVEVKSHLILGVRLYATFEELRSKYGSNLISVGITARK